MRSRVRVWLTIPLVAWTGIVAWLTLQPAGWAPPPTFERFMCVGCGWRGIADMILNLALFVPVGALAGLLLGGRRAVYLGVAFSFGIELAQVWIPGRFASLQDLISNSTGGFLGAYAMALGVPRVAQHSLVVAGFLAWLAPVALLRPLITDAALYGQWAPVFGNGSRFDGEILDVRVGEVTVPPWRAPDSPALAAAIQDRSSVRVEATFEPLPESLAPIFQIMDQRQIEVLSIQGRAQDLHIRGHNLARRLRLDQPDLLWSGAFSGTMPGDTIVLGLDRGIRSTCASVQAEQRCDLAPTLGQGWGFLNYLERAPRALRVLLNLAWIGLLGGAMGVGVRRRSHALLIASAAAVLGVVASALTPDVTVSWLEGALLVGAAAVAASLRVRLVDLWHRAAHV